MIQVRFAATLAALTLVLVGCSDDDPEPQVDPTPSTSATTMPATTSTPEPTPTPPTPPAAVGQPGLEGAKAFVTYFWEVVDYAQVTLDIDSLRRLTSDQCDGCQGALEFLQSVIDNNGTIHGGEGTVSIVGAKQLSVGERKSVSVTFDLVSTRQVVDAPGKKHDQVFPAATVRNRFVVDQLTGNWRVGLWEVLG